MQTQISSSDLDEVFSSLDENTSSSDQTVDESSGHIDVEERLETHISQDVQVKIEKILEEVRLLSDSEKLLLYLKLPGGSTYDDKEDIEQTQHTPLSTTRAEQTQAFHWIRCHLEECDNNSTLPKHEVYDDYKAYCECINAARTLSAPDFGKIIKCVFPRVKARRLGTRGNSKYCYSGIQKKKNVKPPSLPSLQIPSPGDKEKCQSVTNLTGLISSGEKIEEEQTLTAACFLVCEWANKLLGRVFNTLIELARFLVCGSYVSSKSMAAFVVMSSCDNGPPLQHSTNNRFLLGGLKDPSPDEALMLNSKRRQTNQQLQRKIQQRQQQRDHMNAHQNQATPPRIQPPTNQQHLIIHQSPKGINVTPTHMSKHLHTPPRIPNKSNTLQSPPAQITQFIQQQGQANFTRVHPLASPTNQQHISHAQSPFQTSPSFNARAITPQNHAVTPNPSSTPRQTPNSLETTKFVFTPISSHSQDSRHSGEMSPLAIRPMATHPTTDWSQNGPPPTPGGKSDSQCPTPMSPHKQPRLSNSNAPGTPHRRSNSFPYAIPSPQPPITPQRAQAQMFNSQHAPQNQTQMLSPTQNGAGNNQAQRGNEFVSPMSSCMTNQEMGNFGNRVSSGQFASMLSSMQDHTAKSGSMNGTAKSCIYSPQLDSNTLASIQQQQHLMDYSPELENLCSQSPDPSNLPSYQRSQSVPPLNKHTPVSETRFIPLTPQTDIRHMTPPLRNDQNISGLKELRNRVLHGDINNNGSRGNEGHFSARRNLTTLLNAADQTNSWPGTYQNVNTNQEMQATVDNSEKVEVQDMTSDSLMFENFNLSDFTNETFGDLNLPDDPATEAVLQNICNDPNSVWSNDVRSSTGSALEIME